MAGAAQEKFEMDVENEPKHCEHQNEEMSTNGQLERDMN